jgi:hypothetical protein
MSKFINQIDARVSKKTIDGKFTRVVILDRALFYESDLIGNVEVPVGFVSDGASVPRMLWNLYPPFGEYLEAAVVHDLFCVLGHKGESPIDFKMAAKVFKEAMAVCGVSRWKRQKMYLAVRWFGPKFSAKKAS